MSRQTRQSREGEFAFRDTYIHTSYSMESFESLERRVRRGVVYEWSKRD